MSDMQASSFSYEILDEPTRQFVEQKAYETHGLLIKTAESVLLIGQNLRGVKERLPHGQFLSWIEAEFGMSRWTAHHFMQVADKLEDKWGKFHHLPVSVLYELASPSTSEEVIEQVAQGEVAATRDAIAAARTAERKARAEQQLAQQELATMREQWQRQQRTIEDFSQQIIKLQEQIATLSSRVVPPEVQERLDRVQQQLRIATQQRNALAQEVRRLADEAKMAAQAHGQGDEQRRIHLNWSSITETFRTTTNKLLSQWPSWLDTLAFEADDWTRLSQTKEAANRVIKECLSLSENRVINSTASSEEQ